MDDRSDKGRAGSGVGSGIGDEEAGIGMELNPLVSGESNQLDKDSDEGYESSDENNELDEAQKNLRRENNKIPPGLHEFVELDQLGSDPETLMKEVELKKKLVADQFAAPIVWANTSGVRKRKGKGARGETQQGVQTIPTIETFKHSGWDTRVTEEWVHEKVPAIAECTQLVQQLTQMTENMQDELDELNIPTQELSEKKANLLQEIADVKVSMTELANQIANNEEGVTKSVKKVREEMSAQDDPDSKVQLAKLALKVKELRLQTVKPNYKDDFMLIPLRFRRRLLKDESIELAPELYEAKRHNYTWERVRHTLWFGDRERKVTTSEVVWIEHNRKLEVVKNRRGMNKWNPFERIEQDVEQKVGGNISQVFIFYQFIMINNLIMTNLWTIFVIIPYFLDPPAELKWNEISWAGLAGLDDKALEYSWFYYGAYQRTVKIGGFTYRMDYAYIAVMVAMFVFQLGVMLRGVFKALEERPNDLIIETDEPTQGIEYSALLYGGCNHVILDGDSQAGNASQTSSRFKEYLKKDADKVLETEEASLTTNQKRLKQSQNPEDKPNPLLEEIKAIGGRILGVIFYIALFQISTNGIAVCYENEEAINNVIPYGVPILVTSIRVLVPFVMVPFFLQLERRQEPNLFYHTIIRMFLLKMYTMNVILSVLRNLNPIPGGICRAIFIGKVYWRQEMVDLIFSLIMDAGLTIKRRRLPLRPEFDREELAERVMELLYRQAFIWVSAPYSPMLAYLGLFSTSILYFFQWLTIRASYNPPVEGWGRKESDVEFRLLLLATAAATFYPSWTFMHSKMDCGPHQTASSPYDYIKDAIADGPKWLYDITYYPTAPSTTVAILVFTVFTQVYLRGLSQSLSVKVNKALKTMEAESHDKIQLLRANGIKY